MKNKLKSKLFKRENETCLEELSLVFISVFCCSSLLQSQAGKVQDHDKSLGLQCVALSEDNFPLGNYLLPCICCLAFSIESSDRKLILRISLKSTRAEKRDAQHFPNGS